MTGYCSYSRKFTTCEETRGHTIIPIRYKMHLSIKGSLFANHKVNWKYNG